MSLTYPHGPWIDGAYRTGHGPELVVVSPSTANRIATISTPTPEELDRACQSAWDAHVDGRWKQLPVLERQRILMTIANLLRDSDQVWAHRIAEEMGMPETAARFIEVPYAAQTFEYYASCIPQLRGATLPMDIPGAPPEYLTYTLLQPIGVSGLITPWNFPLMLPAWKIAAALAAGCTVVVKPAPESPLTALALGPLFQEAGVPDGVVNIVPGGDDIGAALVSHPRIAKISFTGETTTGRKVLQAAGLGLKRVSAELGGKSPMLIFDDVDLDEAVSQSLFGNYFNSGQVCQATSRILVQEGLYSRFITRFTERVADLRVGNALDPSFDIGPVIRAEKLDLMDTIVRNAIQSGAKLVSGGFRLPGPGFFYAPTIVADVTATMRIAQEEIFGPVAAIMPFRDEDHALELANSSSYGLAAAIMTHDVRRALRCARDIEAGTVWINTVQVLSPTAPFGGVKNSGIGRELGLSGLYEYLENKTVIVDLNDEPLIYF